ncbi:DNA cytosine methyltransferase [Herminiimonas fonticola]|uniref:Cytosine-specific methyltransferase n=1 Tax=Herminiimonas fonticola TaxID=303380 RepID=A0A4R6GIE2_9BURK|nr:DNA (cytosine-5-)-methyltransferase [Herminiimonas fonticola]RBA25504.1 dcm: DNA (cytosine-5-)-methyltransferase [Herminiimonas fonticola]TDN94617.1 DNA (cytosine-5)-methyltransferase 1 [Herminiimonas fonticola]
MDDFKSGSENESYGSLAMPTSFASPKKILRFADLFSGLGGFHVALEKQGMQCIFASELDGELRDIYERNFGLRPEGDIRKVNELDIPPHDVLCAGFPCQPFSSAGKKKGAACPASGKLIDDVFRIVRAHKPSFVMLENVPEILTIQNGEFWDHIKRTFIKLGYTIDYRIYSPHEFGIPQKRERVFVVASQVGLDHFSWPVINLHPVKKLSDLIGNDTETRPLEKEKIKVLKRWQALITEVKTFSHKTTLAAEFGADYPLTDLKRMTLKEMRLFRGAFGASLSECKTWAEVMSKLPHYVGGKDGKTPEWLKQSIIHSRQLYEQHVDFLDVWKTDFIDSHNSWQKMEWRGNRQVPSIWKHTIQFRASGIRISKPDYAPSLVAMTPTQTPIIGAKRRYMSVREAAALQSLDGLKHFPKFNGMAFKALGNAVNAHIVGEIANQLIR